PEMALAPDTHVERVDSDAVVSNQKAQVALTILQLDLHVAGARVEKRVHERFASDAVDAVSHGGGERARRALDDHSQLGRRPAHLLAHPRECLAQVEAVALAGAQAAHRAAPFLDDLRDELLNAPEKRPDGLAFGQLLYRHMELHGGA